MKNRYLSFDQMLAIKRIGGTSLFFVGVPIFILCLVSPSASISFLALGLSYFLPLLIWIIVFSNLAARKTEENRAYAFIFSFTSIFIAAIELSLAST